MTCMKSLKSYRNITVFHSPLIKCHFVCQTFCSINIETISLLFNKLRGVQLRTYLTLEVLLLWPQSTFDSMKCINPNKLSNLLIPGSYVNISWDNKRMLIQIENYNISNIFMKIKHSSTNWWLCNFPYIDIFFCIH